LTPERLAQIQELFDTVREVRANREMLLAAADPDIRREVESLLDQRPDPDLGASLTQSKSSGIRNHYGDAHRRRRSARLLHHGGP